MNILVLTEHTMNFILCASFSSNLYVDIYVPLLDASIGYDHYVAVLESLANLVLAPLMS